MSSAGFIDGLTQDDVLVFAGTHPDDETVIGPLLAYCADRCREVVVISLTRGESGHNLTKEDLTQTLAEVRVKEFNDSVRKLGCTPVMLDYVNGLSRAHPDGLAVLDLHKSAARRWRAAGGQDPKAARARWTEQTGDPVETLRAFLREKQPAVVITFDLEKGFSGHPEHVAMARVTLDAVRAHNRNVEPKATLYCAYDPEGAVQGGERILTSDLSRAGGRDYLALAGQCRALYESQFGPRGSDTSASYVAMRGPAALLLPVDAG